MTKFFLCTIFIQLIWINLTLHAQQKGFSKKKYKTVEQKSKFVLHLAKTYNSNALEILKYAEKPKKYTKYISGDTENSILSNYSTVIHEACHHANHEIGGFESDYWVHGIYISPTIRLRIPRRSVYNSRELVHIIPKERQDSIFRFQTYIAGETDGRIKIPFLSSAKNGIYGILDEFSAYYQGLRADLELYPFYKTKRKDGDFEVLLKFIRQTASDVIAYHEFRLFIAWYLQHARKKHPEVYKDCLENKNLKVGITLVNNFFFRATVDYNTIRSEIIADINKSGKYEAWIDEDGFTRVKEGNGTIGYGGPDRDAQYLQSLFTEECQQLFDGMLIEGLTEENYREYLER